MSQSFTGLISSLEFSDGKPWRCLDCQEDCCECCEGVKPAGTYITIRLDGNPSLSGGRVTVTYEEAA